MPNIGDTIEFDWCDAERLTGEVVDVFHFGASTCYGTRVDGPTAIDPTGCPGGRVYDVWSEYLVRKEI